MSIRPDTVEWLIDELRTNHGLHDPIRWVFNDEALTVTIPVVNPGPALQIGDTVTVNKGSVTEYDGVIVPQSTKIPADEVNVMACETGGVATRRLNQVTRRAVLAQADWFRTPCWCAMGLGLAHERDAETCGPTEAR